MKRSRTASLVVMGLSPLFISACDDTHKSQQVFASVDACTEAGVPATSCQSAYDSAVTDVGRLAPHYNSQDLCAADYESNTCLENTDSSGNAYWSPAMNAFLIARVVRNNSTLFYPAGPIFRKRDLSDYSPHYGGIYAGGGSSGWRPVASEEVAGEGDTVSRGGFGGGEDGGS